MKRLLVLLCLLVSGAESLAETVYVRDTLYVPLRGGQSSEHRILHQGIRSGTELELLEENEDTGFSKVMTKGGMEGWIQTQYLVKEPIARDQLDGVRSRLKAVEEELASTKAELRAARETTRQATERIETLKAESELVTGELARITELAANVIEIEQQNTTLQGEQNVLNEQIDALVVANHKLKDTSSQDWFLRGAGTIVLGLLFGFWVARRVYNGRQSSWN